MKTPTTVKEILKLVNEHEKLYRALKLMGDHYDDLSKSNPGFLGKLCLQDYGLMNEAFIAMENALVTITPPQKATP